MLERDHVRRPTCVESYTKGGSYCSILQHQRVIFPAFTHSFPKFDLPLGGPRGLLSRNAAAALFRLLGRKGGLAACMSSLR